MGNLMIPFQKRGMSWVPFPVYSVLFSWFYQHSFRRPFWSAWNPTKMTIAFAPFFLSPVLSPPDLDQFGNIRNGKNYCWWLKSRTTWNVKKLVNTGRNYISTGAGFQPSTVSLGNMLHLLENGKGVWDHLFFLWHGRKKTKTAGLSANV